MSNLFTEDSPPSESGTPNLLIVSGLRGSANVLTKLSMRKQKGKKANKAKKPYSPYLLFLPFLLPFTFFTKRLARPIAQIENILVSVSGFAPLCRYLW